MLDVILPSRFLFLGSSGLPCALLTGRPRHFEDGLSQAFENSAGRGPSGLSVFAEPSESPGNGGIPENLVFLTDCYFLLTPFTDAWRM